MIQLEKIGKRFRYEWIFRHMSTTFEPGGRYAILGPNGVGKSTLMKILSGHLTPSEGTMRVQIEGKTLDADAIYRHVSYAAPYIEIIEEFVTKEGKKKVIQKKQIIIPFTDIKETRVVFSFDKI